MKVLIVGAGFSGTNHAEAWKKLGHDVTMYDITFSSSFKDAIKTVDPDVVDFCDTPKSRIEYLTDYYDLLEGRKIYVEKPPCRPQDLELYRYVCKWLDITPVHNYLFMPQIKHLVIPFDVAILRSGPHKGWYINPDLTGGGILLDHGYHWLYVADELGIDLNSVKAWVDGIPDMTCVLTSDNFKLYATWKSPVRLTVVDGKVREFRTDNCMVESLIELFRLDDKERYNLRLQSLRVMEFIKGVYKNVGFCVRSEG